MSCAFYGNKKKKIATQDTWRNFLKCLSNFKRVKLIPALRLTGAGSPPSTLICLEGECKIFLNGSNRSIKNSLKQGSCILDKILGTLLTLRVLPDPFLFFFFSV